MRAIVEKRSKRWQEQRWLLDAILQTIGVEWDQPRLAHFSHPAGPEAAGDFRRAGQRIARFDDVHREFRNGARRRQTKAEAFEAQGRLVAARESYITAALLWAAARWPLYEIDDAYREYESRMVACYAKFIEFAPHPIERVEIPFGDGALAGYLHLPRAPADGERFACLLNIGGMDGCKENVVAMYGDKALERGIAVLALDGPGQGESPSRGIFVTESNHRDAGLAAIDFMAAHPHLDADRLALRCTSFGSYFGTHAAAALGDRIKACATAFSIHEPGAYTIFHSASPTFKMRFMFMAGYTDEDAFDSFTEKFELGPVAGDITCPYLIIMGEDDELSPIEYTYELFDAITAPKTLAVYEGARHAVGSAASASLGENPATLTADWLADRLAGKPLTSEKLFIDDTGKMEVTPVAG